MTGTIMKAEVWIGIAKTPTDMPQVDLHLPPATDLNTYVAFF